MNKIQQALEKVSVALQLEKKADFEKFREEVLQLSKAERRNKGLCWYPLAILKTGYTIGERAFVSVERTAERDKAHRLRSGMPIELYSGENTNKSSQSARGIIHFVDRNKMKLVLNQKELPEWLNEGNLAVDMLFDERTYLEMEKTMKVVLKAKGNRLHEFKKLFYGELQADFSAPPDVFHSYLNSSQVEAVKDILSAKDIAVVHGPPGTGKTTTLVQAIKLMAQHEKNILVTATSNAAVDLLVERLDAQGLNVVRIGNISRVEERLLANTLEGRLSQHPESKNIKRLKIQAANARKGAKKFKKRFGGKQRAQRQEQYQDARELENYAKMLETRLLNEILWGADVIAATLVNTVARVLENIDFKTVVIDEAAQALEPANWIPLTKVEKVVLAGDPFQLPAVIKSTAAKKMGLGISLLEKWVLDQKPTSFLEVQYRMHPTIMEFSINNSMEDN